MLVGLRGKLGLLIDTANLKNVTTSALRYFAVIYLWPHSKKRRGGKGSKTAGKCTFFSCEGPLTLKGGGKKEGFAPHKS